MLDDESIEDANEGKAQERSAIGDPVAEERDANEDHCGKTQSDTQSVVPLDGQEAIALGRIHEFTSTAEQRGGAIRRPDVKVLRMGDISVRRSTPILYPIDLFS